MPSLVKDLIDGAAARIRDPQNRRIDRALWLQFYNEVTLKIATELKCLEADANFDVVAAEDRYAYPDDAVVINQVYFSLTPTDINSYKPLGEIFRDEWIMGRGVMVPTGLPTRYYARQGWFTLVPKPDTAIIDGGCVTYRHIPEWLTSEASQAVELPTFMGTFVVDGMIPRAERALRLFAASRENQAQWEQELERMKPQIQDRSEDRRSAIRPPGHIDPFSGMS